MWDESLLNSIRSDYLLNVLGYAQTLIPEGMQILDDDLDCLIDRPIHNSDAPQLEHMTIKTPVMDSDKDIKELGEQLEAVSIKDDVSHCDLEKTTVTSQLPTSKLQVNSGSNTKLQKVFSFTPAEFSNYIPVSTKKLTEFFTASPELDNANTVRSNLSPVVDSIPCESATISSSRSFSTPQTLAIIPTTLETPHGVFSVPPSVSCSSTQKLTNLLPCSTNSTSHSSVSDKTFMGTNRGSCILSDPPADVLQTQTTETDESSNMQRESESNLTQPETVDRIETSSLEAGNMRNIVEETVDESANLSRESKSRLKQPDTVNWKALSTLEADNMLKIVEETEELCMHYKCRYAKKAALVNMLVMGKLLNLSPLFYKEDKNSLLELSYYLRVLLKDLISLKKRTDEALMDYKEVLSDTPSQLGLIPCNLVTRYKLCSLLLGILSKFCNEKYDTLLRIFKDFTAHEQTTNDMTNSKTC